MATDRVGEALDSFRRQAQVFQSLDPKELWAGVPRRVEFRTHGRPVRAHRAS